MKKPWNERIIRTEEQSLHIEPNETQDGVILRIVEAADNSDSRLYLTYAEAQLAGLELIDFVKSKTSNHE